MLFVDESSTTASKRSDNHSNCHLVKKGPSSSGPPASSCDKTEDLSSSSSEEEEDSSSSSSSSDGISETSQPQQNVYKFITMSLRNAWHHIVAKHKILLAGQVLSFLLASSGAAQATLALECHLTGAPAFTIGLFYLVLSFSLIPVILDSRKSSSIKKINSYYVHPSAITDDDVELDNHDHGHKGMTNSSCCCSNKGHCDHDGPPSTTSRTITDEYSFLFGLVKLQAPAWSYFLMAVLDVYANYFTVLAFRYTTITSVTLLDALAIPSAMALSKFCLRRQYSAAHYAGAVICMCGIGFNVLQDIHSGDDDGADTTYHYPHKLRGDILALTGGLLFGANNVLGEIAVRKFGGPNEYIGMLGFFATLICAVQTLLYERDNVAAFIRRDVVDGGDDGASATCGLAEARWLLVAFVVTNVLSYTGTSRFLLHSEAAFFNLSLLTGDLWSVAFSVVQEHIVPPPLFYVALVCTISGVLIYETAPTPVLEDRVEIIGCHDDDEDSELRLTLELVQHMQTKGRLETTATEV